MYIIRYSKFQSVANITLHFPDNFGGDTTQIHYIGLKGEATQVIYCLTFDGCIVDYIFPKKNVNIFFHVWIICAWSETSSLWFLICLWVTVEKGCCCNNCLWTDAKSFRSQVRLRCPCQTVLNIWFTFLINLLWYWTMMFWINFVSCMIYFLLRQFPSSFCTKFCINVLCERNDWFCSLQEIG